VEQDDGGMLGLPRARGWLADERLDFPSAVAASDRGNRNPNRLLRLYRRGDDRLLRATRQLETARSAAAKDTRIERRRTMIFISTPFASYSPRTDRARCVNAKGLAAIQQRHRVPRLIREVNLTPRR
jgi:hypothetical protein